MKTVVVGNLTWDRLIRVPHLPATNEDVLIDDDSTHPGGAAGNVAASLALLGLETSLFAAVGDDAPGDALVEDVRAYGVDTTAIQRVGRRTSHFLCVMDRSGDRAFLLDPRDAAFALGPCLPDHRTGSRVAFVGCRLAAAQRVLQDRPTFARTAVANIGFWAASRELTADVGPWLANLECLFLNRDEWESLPAPVQSDVLSDQQMVGRRRVVITDGARDAVVLSPEGTSSRAPAPLPRLANTLGCGDAFMAGYLAEHWAGRDLQACLERGHNCAASIAALETERALAQFGEVR